MWSDIDAGISFDELNRKAEKQMSDSLEAIENRLYRVEISESMAQAIEPEEEEDPYRRYGTNQYHAHVDGVTDKELIQWQSIAPFLRVEGASIHHLCPSYEDLLATVPSSKDDDIPTSLVNEDGFVYADRRVHGQGSLCVDWTQFKDAVIFTPSTYTYLNPTPPSGIKPTTAHTHTTTSAGMSMELEGDEEEQLSLGLVGKACTFYMRENTVQQQQQQGEVEEGDTTIEQQHGLLEEVLEVHCDPAEKTSSQYKDPDEWPPSHSSNAGEGELPWTKTFPTSPRAVQQEECVAILAEGIWGDVVDALRPMIETVVKASHESNLVYDDDDDDDDGTGTGSKDEKGGGQRVSANQQEGERGGHAQVLVMDGTMDEEGGDDGAFEAVTIMERKNSFDDWGD